MCHPVSDRCHVILLSVKVINLIQILRWSARFEAAHHDKNRVFWSSNQFYGISTSGIVQFGEQISKKKNSIQCNAIPYHPNSISGAKIGSQMPHAY